MKRQPDATRRSGLGLMLLAIGRSRGFACFGADVPAYLASLAPWVALALVSSGIHALQAPHEAADIFLMWICSLLGPPVIAHFLCRRWGRLENWALYANILNWVPFLSCVLFVCLTAITHAAAQAGAPSDPTAAIGLGAFFGYWIWLQWFIARGALAISRRRAAFLVFLIWLFSLGLALVLALFSNVLPELQLNMK